MPRMRRSLLPLTALAAFTLLAVLPALTRAWGFWSHRQITRLAVASLPPEMSGFYGSWADTLVAWSVLPDTRRNADSTEGPRHFIDIDRYGSYPYKELPQDYAEAARVYGKATVDTNGTAPWAVLSTLQRLTDALRTRDGKAILAASADLAHYVADCHVPLHATANYDGQLSGQRGIHSRWESGLPERFGSGYALVPGNAAYLANPRQEIFRIVLESARLVDSVLAADRVAREGLSADQLYAKEERKGRRAPEFSREYYERLHAAMNGMVERRLQASIGSVASFWYTAWIDAGKPDTHDVRW